MTSCWIALVQLQADNGQVSYLQSALAWLEGWLAEQRGALDEARGIYDEVPGELAPKLALAFAAEAGDDIASARRYFRLVWTVDRSCISAAFGLANLPGRW